MGLYQKNIFQNYLKGIELIKIFKFKKVKINV